VWRTKLERPLITSSSSLNSDVKFCDLIGIPCSHARDLHTRNDMLQCRHTRRVLYIVTIYNHSNLWKAPNQDATVDRPLSEWRECYAQMKVKREIVKLWGNGIDLTSQSMYVMTNGNISVCVIKLGFGWDRGWWDWVRLGFGMALLSRANIHPNLYSPQTVDRSIYRSLSIKL